MPSYRGRLVAALVFPCLPVAALAVVGPPGSGPEARLDPARSLAAASPAVDSGLAVSPAVAGLVAAAVVVIGLDLVADSGPALAAVC